MACVKCHGSSVCVFTWLRQGHRLFQLKNPWSHLRWRGNFSELDTVHWTESLKRALNYDPHTAAAVDNGKPVVCCLTDLLFIHPTFHWKAPSFDRHFLVIILQICRNRPVPFPCQILFKVTKPGFNFCVVVTCSLLMHIYFCCDSYSFD